MQVSGYHLTLYLPILLWRKVLESRTLIPNSGIRSKVSTNLGVHSQGVVWNSRFYNYTIFHPFRKEWRSKWVYLCSYTPGGQFFFKISWKSRGCMFEIFTQLFWFRRCRGSKNPSNMKKYTSKSSSGYELYRGMFVFLPLRCYDTKQGRSP